MDRMGVILVVIMSLLIGGILNKLALSKGWKKKAEIYAEERAYIRMLPIVLIGLYLITVLVLPRVGIVLPVPMLVTVQVICITLAIFLFDLFK